MFQFSTAKYKLIFLTTWTSSETFDHINGVVRLDTTPTRPCSTSLAVVLCTAPWKHTWSATCWEGCVNAMTSGPARKWNSARWPLLRRRCFMPWRTNGRCTRWTCIPWYSHASWSWTDMGDGLLIYTTHGKLVGKKKTVLFVFVFCFNFLVAYMSSFG